MAVSPLNKTDEIQWTFAQITCREQKMRIIWKIILITSAYLAAASFVQPSTALAQEIPSEKKFEIYSDHGVNIYSLQFSKEFKDISVGSGAFPSRLDLVRKYQQFPYQPIYGNPDVMAAPFASHSVHNFFLTAFCFPCDMGWSHNGHSAGPSPEHVMTVSAFDGVHSFSAAPAAWGSARTWTNRYNDGATIVDNGDHVELTTKSGDLIVYSHTEPNGTGIGCGGACAVALYARFASGEMIIFDYQKAVSSSWSESRLVSVTNSRGYGLQFSYLNPSLTTGDMQARGLISSVTAFRTGCVAGVVNCNSGDVVSVSYAYSVVSTASTGTAAYPAGAKAYRLTSFTQADGSVVKYEYGDPGFRLTGAYYESTPSIKLFQNTYMSGIVPGGGSDGKEGEVSSVVDAQNQSTTYSGGINYYTPNSGSTSTITFADGSVYIYAYPGRRENKTPLPSTVTVPGSGSSSRIYSYTYNSSNQVMSEAFPGGNSIQYERDNRGNVTKITQVPTSGSGNEAIIQDFAFPSCSSVNFRICNKPIYAVSAHYASQPGFRTDYLYDEGHGGLAVELRPADAEGNRAVVRNYYASYYPAPGVVAPAGGTLTSANLLVGHEECKVTGVLGTTIDFTYVCPATSRKRENLIYSPSTPASRSNFELEAAETEAPDGSLRTCYKYNVVGDVISTRRPRGGATCQ